MRSFSLVCLLLVGAALHEANAQRRRYVNDRDSENQIDSTGSPVEEPERHHHHHRHHRHHHGRNHRGFHHRSGVNLSQAEETIEFHRFFMRSVRSLAEQSGLCNDDVNTLLNILEENRPPFKKEDRSQWTEEQWQVSKEEREQRKQLVRKQAYEQIQDQVHLTIFFDKLEAQKKLIKENIHKYIVARLTRIAVRSGLNDSQIDKFIRELESHKPVGVHWRPGMSQNEKKKNIEIHVKNWQQIKEACLRDASEAEQTQLNRFFVAVEKDFARSMHGDHDGERHHGRRHHRHRHHRRHNDEEDFPRESVRGHRRHHNHDDETESVDTEVRRPHRRHRHHHEVDEDFEERPRRHHHHRRHHHETEDEDQAPLRRRSEEVDDSEEHRHHRRHHHHHRRPHHVANSDDSEESVEDAPEPHHRRHSHQHRRHHRHQEEDSDNSEERKDEDFKPRRYHHHHHRQQNRHGDSEDIDDAKVRPEPYRHYRRHVRRQDSAEE